MHRAGIPFGIALIVVACVLAEPAACRDSQKSDDTAPVRQVGVYVLPYYQAADDPSGQPKVAVAKAFDAQLSSNKQEDIVAVRDAIKLQPQRITPMTLMVLAIRLYDVGLRDESVFWFYVAKNRYFTMSDVLNVNSQGLVGVEDAVRGFAVLAGPFINSYAFCDLNKQKEQTLKAIEWVEQHPYEVLFMQQLPALPGDRAANLKKSIDTIKARSAKEQAFLAEPKNAVEMQKARSDHHVVEQFCWKN